jgi:aldose 1-epimerase
MSFSIDIQPISNFKKVHITNNANGNSIDIITKGGLLNSWKQSIDQWDIIDGNDFEQGWGNFESDGFKSGKMSPYACRLYKGQYTHLNKSYQIEKFYLGDHALHGILYDAEYEIKDTTIKENSAGLTLVHHYLGTDKGFPFNYEIVLTWTFHSNNKVNIQTTITNQSTQTIPMMDGWHPYFTLGECINNCTLQFEHKGMLVYDKALLPTGSFISNPQFNSPALISNTHLDNGYLMDTSNPTCTLENEKYTLIVQSNKEYPYLQLYTAPNRKSIAIENLTAAPNCFNNKMGLHIMQPQEVWTLETSYQLISK